MIRLAVGYDHREAIAYHTFVQSVLERSSEPVSFSPIVLSSLKGYQDTQNDGSNEFIYSRFLTPWLFNFDGWVIFADGDMICLDDIANLWRLRDESKAVMVVKHDYKTKATVKYLGNKNVDYPRKNWSSLILWNCGHPKHRLLIPTYVINQTGKFLHRFSWLEDSEIGELPKEWNWLTTEYTDNYEAKLLHYTLGTPCFKDYANSEMSDVWHNTYERVKRGIED